MKPTNQKNSYQYVKLPTKLFGLITATQVNVLFYLLTRGIAMGDRKLSALQIAQACKISVDTAKRAVNFLADINVIRIERSISYKHAYSLKDASDWDINSGLTPVHIKNKANVIARARAKSLAELLIDYQAAVAEFENNRNKDTAQRALKAKDTVINRMRRSVRNDDRQVRKILKNSQNIFSLSIDPDCVHSHSSISSINLKIKEIMGEK